MKKLSLLLLMVILSSQVFYAATSETIPVMSYDQYLTIEHQCEILQSNSKYVIIQINGKKYMVPISS